MIENVIVKWFNEDEKLSSIINAIDASNKDLELQALDAFYQVAEVYDLPKYPSDFTDAHYNRFEEMGVNDPRSVFEEASIIKYLEPNDDPRGIAMLALYNVKNGTFIDVENCAIKHFGSAEKVPSSYFVCFIGDGFAGNLKFLTQTENWTETGARCMIKVFRP